MTDVDVVERSILRREIGKLIRDTDPRDKPSQICQRVVDVIEALPSAAPPSEWSSVEECAEAMLPTLRSELTRWLAEGQEASGRPIALALARVALQRAAPGAASGGVWYVDRSRIDGAVSEQWVVRSREPVNACTDVVAVVPNKEIADQIVAEHRKPKGGA